MSMPPPQLTSRRPELAAAVDQVFARALAKAPADRYARCADFAEALREALGLAPYHSSPGLISSPVVIPSPDKPTVDHPVTQAAWSAEAAVAHATVSVTGARAGGPPALAARNAGARDGAADYEGPRAADYEGPVVGDYEGPGAGEPTARPAPPKSIVHAVRIMYAGAALPVIIAVVALLIALAGK